jgi:hypothetical protein
MASQSGGFVIGNFFTTNSILAGTDSTFGGIMQLERKTIRFHTGIWLLPGEVRAFCSSLQELLVFLTSSAF